MCKLTTKFAESDTFTGYKAVIKHGDNYLSPATGITYKIGKVPVLNSTTERDTSVIRGYSDKFKDFTSLAVVDFFKPEFNGKTAVFVKSMDAVEVSRTIALDWCETELPLVIIKMTISGDLHRGTAAVNEFDHTGSHVVAGDTIVSIEEVTL